MENTSRDLLRFEQGNPSASDLESALLVCNKRDSRSEIPQFPPDKKLVTAPVAKSEVLGKVRDFLGVISEANKRLELDAKENSQAYDIEALTGDETQVIEMDLMLGVADLNTPDAVAAAESAIAGNQPVTPLAASSSGDDDDSDDESDDDDNDDDKSCSLKTGKDDLTSESAKKKRSKKRPRIIELP